MSAVPFEPTGEQIGAAVLAFQESTKHVKLNITTAQFVLAMVAALQAADAAGGTNYVPSNTTTG